ncbi:MAG: hypothetical protein Q8K62_03575 [Thiobacillus sp.]|nr:hypothetical protein [Thiobacillus sp.]
MERLAQLFALSFFTFLACTTSYATPRNDVLIIVNDNSYDSPLLGAYYAQQRNIAPANVIHVNIPNQYYIDWIQFTSLRDQILRQGICSSLAPASRPVACTDTNQTIYTQENIDTLTAHTPIKYIVTTRGVPSRVKTAHPDSTESTSADNYLRHLLARFYLDNTFPSPPSTRKSDFSDGRGMRVVNPATDKEYIIGRIDGVDLSSAKELLNRAIRVEANGLFGNLFASTFGNVANGGAFNWVDDKDLPIYLPEDNTKDYWRYAFGLLGENRPECADYTNNYLAKSQSDLGDGTENNTGGKTPKHCLVQLNKGEPNEAIPGLAYSRQPQAINAMGYFGSLDGQTIEGGFPTLLNWRKNDTCTVTLCENAAVPAACRAISTDPFKEINTDCVGVADGFIGFNFQSFPLSIFGIWPTGWSSLNVDYNDTPVIREGDGQDGSYSAWFTQIDDVSGTSRQRVGIQQIVTFSEQPKVNQEIYQFSYYVKGENTASTASITSGLRAEYSMDSNATNTQSCPNDPAYVLSVDGKTCTFTDEKSNHATSAWSSITREIIIPALVGWKNTSIVVRFWGGQLPVGGNIGLDKVSLTNLNDLSATNLLVNGSFSQGHKQTSQGDFAANFLSRLGGTAFWGSLSHHGSAGHTFDEGALGTLVYFLRGLPLGDAVWLGEKFSDGDLYGDPLFSPLSVRINNSSTNIWNFLPLGIANISGNAVNGRNPLLVSTLYSLDYCKGHDFFKCGTANNSWISTGVNGVGPAENTSFGSWDTTSMPAGEYTIRLSVTSSNVNNGKHQTFFDYWPVKLFSATSDFDSDGVKDISELSRGGNPTSNIDSDKDGLPDDLENIIYGTNPNNADSDVDGLKDGAEVLQYHTDPLNADADGDHLTDSEEVNLTHTDPNNKFSMVPNVLDGDLDPFGDGVGYRAKIDCGLSVTQSQNQSGLDSDNDGMGDLTECKTGRNPFVNEPGLVPNILFMLGF